MHGQRTTCLWSEELKPVVVRLAEHHLECIRWQKTLLCVYLNTTWYSKPMFRDNCCRLSVCCLAYEQFEQFIFDNTYTNVVYMLRTWDSLWFRVRLNHEYEGDRELCVHIMWFVLYC